MSLFRPKLFLFAIQLSLIACASKTTHRPAQSTYAKNSQVLDLLKSQKAWENDPAGGNPSAGISFSLKNQAFQFWYRECLYLGPEQDCPEEAEYRSLKSEGQFAIQDSQEQSEPTIELVFSRSLPSTRFTQTRFVMQIVRDGEGLQNEDLGLFEPPFDPLGQGEEEGGDSPE